MSLGLLAWWSVLGWPSTGWDEEGSYPARSPSLKRTILFDDAEVWAEVWRMLDENAARPEHDRTPAVQLIATTAKMWTRPERLLTAEAREWARQYRLCKALGLPPGPSLDAVPVRLADAFVTLDMEIAAARAYQAGKGR